MEVVLGIVAILIIVAVAGVKGREFVGIGKTAKAHSEVVELGGMVSQYKFEIGEYPATLDKLKQKNGDYGPWIKMIPKDPWGREYVYLKNADGFAIWSKGADGSSSSDLNKIGDGDIGLLGK